MSPNDLGPFRGIALRPAATFFALAVILLVHYCLLWPGIQSADNDFDALNLYLPLAHHLSEQGLRFFGSEESLRAPAFSYVYPAIVGESLHTLKVTNATLSGITVLLLFRCASLLHSTFAGVMTAALFALSPVTRPYLSAPITEAPVMLLGATWLWGVAESIHRPRNWPAWIAGAALGLAALTRATMFYWIPLVLLGLCWRYSKLKEPKWRHILGSHLLALLLPTIFIVKSWVLFRFPFFTTGGGNALYLGNNPLTGGYDPNYLGLYFDVGSIARDMHHLSLRAERLLGAVARLMLSQESIPFLVRLHAKKLVAFLFVTNAEDNVLVLRTWRIGLFVLAAVGAFRARGPSLRWLVGGMLLYQIAIHIPVLYTHRYSVGAMDLWLTVLAGVGLAITIAAPRAFLAVMSVAAAICICGLTGYFAYGFLPQPNVFAVPRAQIWEGAPSEILIRGTDDPVYIPVEKTTPMMPWANYVLVLDARIRAQGVSDHCTRLYVSYRPDKADEFSGPKWQRLPSDGQPRLLQYGGAPLKLNKAGMVRLTTDCTGPALLRIARAAIYMPLGSFVWREQLLGERHMFQYEQ